MTGDHYLKTAVNSFGESEPPNTAVANCGTSICLMAEPLDDANMGRIDETRPDGMTFRSTTAVSPPPERPITDQTATEENVSSLTAAAVTQLAAAGTLQTTVIDYDYDPLYRLTGANYTGAITATYAYDYDAVGNMTAYTETVGGETTYVGRTFDAANQLLTSYDGSETTDYGYDNNGNLLAVTQAAPLVPGSKVGQGYSYDQRNLLRIGYTIGPVNTLDVDFIYDGDGNRLQQIDHTGSKSITTTYTNDNTGLSQVLVADDGTEQVYNLYGLDLLAQDDGAEIRTLLADGLGSVRAEMVGSAVETVTTYSPYGKLLAQTGESGTPYGFTGEQHDGVTGLVYLRARYYNPYIYRMLTPDPIVPSFTRPQSLNRYSYTENNPVGFTDPSGLARIKIWVSAFISPSSIEFPYPYSAIGPVPGPLVDFDARWEGDNRSFYAGGTSRPSARQWHEVILDTEDPTLFIVSNEAGVGTTRVEYEDLLGNSYLAVGTAPPQSRAGIVWLGESIFVGIEGIGPNPLISVSPPIDYAYNIVFDLAKGEVGISGLHDWFPWHEVYIEVNGIPISPPPVSYVPSVWPKNPVALAYLPQPVSFDEAIPALKEDSPNYCVFT